jgi:phospholipase/carboxylesterase
MEMSSPSRLREIRMYLIHGALDWLFPVEGSREAYQALQRTGVDIRYREIEGLSHSYPDEENESILQWYRE